MTFVVRKTSHKRQALKNEHTELTLKGFILAHEWKMIPIKGFSQNGINLEWSPVSGQNKLVLTLWAHYRGIGKWSCIISLMLFTANSKQNKKKTKHPFIKWPIIVRAPLTKEQHITLPKQPTTNVAHLVIDFWQHAVLSVSLQPLENPNTEQRL